MENRFLLTYSVPSTEFSGRINLFKWEDSEEDVKDFIDEMNSTYGVAFQIIEIVEIIESREVNINEL